MKRIDQLLERLGALQRSESRRYAQEHGLQMVHLEVLNYLHRCNRYSDTTQALSEYLGQTKGSISQTLAFLEGEGLLRRTRDEQDRRVFHLALSPKARRLVHEFEERFYGEIDLETLSEKSLTEAISRLQKKNGLKGFGLCAACHHNSNPGGQKFQCGLTGESLTVEDTKLICREFQSRDAG